MVSLIKEYIWDIIFKIRIKTIIYLGKFVTTFNNT
jgi:hypothetical protein